MTKFWSDFLVQTLAGLAVAAILGMLGYARSEKFREWINSARYKVVVAIKWLARQWKYILAAVLVVIFEFVVYISLQSSLAIVLSLLQFVLTVFLYRLFKFKPLSLTNQSVDWPDLLVSCNWVLVFKPPDQFKPISFLSNGSIGEGQNQNEHTWRIQNGKLELVQKDGRVHSRFNFDEKTRRFIHTNESDTLSVRSQIIRMV